MLVQTEDIAKLSGGSAHIRVFETAIECCKALQIEQWDMYIGSKAALPTSHQTSEESFTPDSKSAVVISAADVPQCFLQAAKKTFHAGEQVPHFHSITSSDIAVCMGQMGPVAQSAFNSSSWNSACYMYVCCTLKTCNGLDCTSRNTT